MSSKHIYLPAGMSITVSWLAGCAESGPDYTPIGEGMKAIGICFVVCTVIGALVELLKRDRAMADSREHETRRKNKSRKEQSNDQ